MTNRTYMQTLSDDEFESVIYHLNEGDFDIADSTFDPTIAVLNWLKAAYDPNDKIWGIVAAELDPAGWDEDE